MREFYNKNKYTESPFSYPKMDNVSEEEKNKPEYNLKMCEAIMHLYLTNKCAIPYSSYNSMKLLRQFAQGREPSSIYKAAFSDEDASNTTPNSADRETELKGWMASDFNNITTFIPKVINIIKGIYADVDWEIKGNAVDIDAGVEEENAMIAYWAKTKFLKDSNEIRANAGMPQEELDYEPDTLDELRMIKEEGGFKQPYLMDIEKIIKYAEQESKWESRLKPKLLVDILTLNKAISYRKLNIETLTEEWVYIDPEDYIGQYSKNYEHEDSDFEGHIERWSFSELRRLGVSEEKLSGLSNNMFSLYGNPSEAQWEKNKATDDFKADVLILYWQDVIDTQKIEYTTKNGEKRYLKYDKTINERIDKDRKRVEKKFGTEYKSKSDKYYLGKSEKVINSRKRMKRHCKWVIGTDIILDNEYAKNQVRLKRNRPENHYAVYIGKERSLVDLLRKPQILFNISTLRMENTLARATEAGYAIDTSVLTTGKKGDNWVKAVIMHRQTGYLPYKGTPNLLDRGGSPVPIQYIPGTLGEGLSINIASIDRSLKMVEDVTGMSAVMLGATPPKETQVGTQQMSLNSGNQVIRLYEDILKTIKSRLANSSAEGMQIIIQTDKNVAKNYEPIIGKDGVERLKKAKKYHWQYGLKLLAKPTGAQLEQIFNDINIAYQKKQQGLAGINEAEKIQLRTELINGGNMYNVMYKMSSYIRKDEERIKQASQENIILTGNQNKEMKQIEGQNAQEILKLEMRNHILKSNIDADKELVVADRKTRNNIIEELIKEDAVFRDQVKSKVIDFNLKTETTPQNQNV